MSAEMELLEVLNEVLTQHELHPTLPADLIEKIRAVVAKAEGK